MIHDSRGKYFHIINTQEQKLLLPPKWVIPVYMQLDNVPSSHFIFV